MEALPTPLPDDPNAPPSEPIDVRDLPLRSVDTPLAERRGLLLIFLGLIELSLMALLAFLQESNVLNWNAWPPAVMQSAVIIGGMGALIGLVVGISQNYGWFTVALVGVLGMGGVFAGGTLAGLLLVLISPVIAALRG